ncbi:hypothetical protein ACEPAI_4888 [Sanghuangporus weigelae]
MAELGLVTGENAQPQQTTDPEIPHRPDGIQVDGQTFATTVLFALSCSPLLRAHLLQSLNATSQELDSLEPFLSAAWDQWDQARRMRHTEQVTKARLQEHRDRQQLQTSEQTGGQMFAETLLLTLSYQPLLRAHLLRILNITNEELCSFEPVLSAAWDQRDRAAHLLQGLGTTINEFFEFSEAALPAAWDQWDRARRLHKEQDKVVQERRE